VIATLPPLLLTALGFTVFALAVAFILAMIFSYCSGWTDGREEGRGELNKALYEDAWRNGWQDCAHQHNLPAEIPAPEDWNK